jgi:hypothetical protein
MNPLSYAGHFQAKAFERELKNPDGIFRGFLLVTGKFQNNTTN